MGNAININWLLLRNPPEVIAKQYVVDEISRTEFREIYEYRDCPHSLIDGRGCCTKHLQELICKKWESENETENS